MLDLSEEQPRGRVEDRKHLENYPHCEEEEDESNRYIYVNIIKAFILILAAFTPLVMMTMIMMKKRPMIMMMKRPMIMIMKRPMIMVMKKLTQHDTMIRRARVRVQMY